MNDIEANTLWQNESVDLEGVKAQATKFEEWLNNEAEKILARREAGEFSEFKAIARMDKLKEIKRKFEWKLELMSAGMSMDDIIETADDARHIIEDTYNPEEREKRKQLKRLLKSIPREDREAMIDKLLEEGEIDEDQYSYLCSEFL